ncbi:hypothetical protein DL89DRAFT_262110 [Linderina pennispora]|uniref:Uncharacterized protein n=1 Tax=Linderina pennispora TaxID=61395 RepID=A0A1Y1VV31_9FUNG|nr:uncharacterized protein DL89DRAFT_262110 [Linderina pennispora]ORX64624.1 hypothetical protein DL89DRAFT_262110 [Linderina pennispora]
MRFFVASFFLAATAMPLELGNHADLTNIVAGTSSNGAAANAGHAAAVAASDTVSASAPPVHAATSPSTTATDVNRDDADAKADPVDVNATPSGVIANVGSVDASAGQNRANPSVSPNGADATKPSAAISPIKANVQNLIKIILDPKLLEKMKQTLPCQDPPGQLVVHRGCPEESSVGTGHPWRQLAVSAFMNRT